MISKELLSEVLNREIGEVHINGNEVAIYPREGIARSLINIYELAHKCKEWATYYGYELVSSTFLNSDNEDIEGTANIGQYYFPQDTEPEAIFKACQWILENKDNS